MLVVLMLASFKADVQYARGDVSRDGQVDIYDITSLINYVLSGSWGDELAGPVMPDRGDVNGDSQVDIYDITSLINYVLSGSWDDEPVVPGVPGELTVPMQGGKLENGLIMGRITVSRSYNFFNYRHSVKMIDIEGCTLTGIDKGSDETLTVLCYDDNGCYQSAVHAIGDIPATARYVKLMLSRTSAYGTTGNIKVSYDVNKAKPTLHDNLPAKAYEQTVDGATRFVAPQVDFSFETSIKSVFPDQGFVIDDNRYFDNGFIKLPANYSIDGDPVPLVVFVHGTSGYPFAGTVTGYDTYYKEVQAFIVRNGYAVCDCSGITSKNADINNYGVINMFCSPSFAAAVVNMVQFLMQNYNLRSSGIYLYGKSSGGMMVHMPLLVDELDRQFSLDAVGSLAPALSPTASSRTYAKWYYSDIMTRIAAELGVKVGEDGHAVTFTQGSSSTAKLEGEQLEAIVSDDNIARWRKIDGFLGYNTNLTDSQVSTVANSCNDNVTANAANPQTNPIAYAICVNAQRTINVPLKVWNFSGDHAVYNPMSEMLCNTANYPGNTNAECVYKLVEPTEGYTVGHHADDTNPMLGKYKLPDLGNPGGKEVEASAVYIDLVEWFRKHGGVKNDNNGENYNVWDSENLVPKQ